MLYGCYEIEGLDVFEEVCFYVVLVGNIFLKYQHSLVNIVIQFFCILVYMKLTFLNFSGYLDQML